MNYKIGEISQEDLQSNNYKEIDRIRVMKGVTFKELAKDLPISQDGLNKAFKRGKVKSAYLNHIKTYLGIKEVCNKDNFKANTKAVNNSYQENYRELDSLLMDANAKLFIIEHIYKNEKKWLDIPEFKKLLKTLNRFSQIESMRYELDKLKSEFKKHLNEK